MHARSVSFSKNVPAFIVWNAPWPRVDSGTPTTVPNSDASPKVSCTGHPDVRIDVLHVGQRRERAQSRRRRAPAVADRARAAARSDRPGRPAAARDRRPRLAEGHRSAAAPAAGTELASPIGVPRGRDRDHVEQARIGEAADELLLQADAERHHAGERGDADRHAEHRQRRAQLRLAEVAERRARRYRQASCARTLRRCAPSSIVIVRCA